MVFWFSYLLLLWVWFRSRTGCWDVLWYIGEYDPVDRWQDILTACKLAVVAFLISLIF